MSRLIKLSQDQIELLEDGNVVSDSVGRVYYFQLHQILERIHDTEFFYLYSHYGNGGQHFRELPEFVQNHYKNMLADVVSRTYPKADNISTTL